MIQCLDAKANDLLGNHEFLDFLSNLIHEQHSGEGLFRAGNRTLAMRTTVVIEIAHHAFGFDEFSLPLCRDICTTAAAPEKPFEWEIEHPITSTFAMIENTLCFFELCLRDHRLMGANVLFSPPLEEAAVKLIAKDVAEGRERNKFASTVQRAMLLHVTIQLHHGTLVFEQLLPERLNDKEEIGVWKNPLCPFQRLLFIQVSDRRFTRQPSLLHLARHATLYICAELANVIR